jgi:hypothetical protein
MIRMSLREEDVASVELNETDRPDALCPFGSERRMGVPDWKGELEVDV